MQIITLPDIRPILEDKAGIIQAVKDGFIAHGQGQIQMPPPVQMMFETKVHKLAGDCHIKTAYSDRFPYFCIKVATGFYENPDHNLPVNNGLVMLFSAKTGQPLILFQDEGHLTSARTAAAGALAAKLKMKSGPQSLGVIGTGHQAELQIRWISAYCDISSVTIWGRATQKAEALQARLEDLDLRVDISKTIKDMTDKAGIIVTSTPSGSPLLMNTDIRRGHHIIAMGSDSPGKVELDPDILGRADVIITDDHDQCLSHGEFGYAVRYNYVSENADRNLGYILGHPDEFDADANSVSVVDLTGLGAQDLAIAAFVYERLNL